MGAAADSGADGDGDGRQSHVCALFFVSKGKSISIFRPGWYVVSAIGSSIMRNRTIRSSTGRSVFSDQSSFSNLKHYT